MTKFDELFGPKISGRVFTIEQTKHAKTVVPSEKELFLGAGYNNRYFGKHRVNLPLPKNADYGALMAITYYFIGNIRKQNLPYFKKNKIAAYNWGLVAGKIQTQYPWASLSKKFTAEPKVWHHDVLNPDGTPHIQSEVDLMKSLTSKNKQ